MSGEWLIRQAGTDRDGTTVERITIESNVPLDSVGDQGIAFTWPDGRYMIFPWNNILRAEYRPHNEP